jgi:endoglucanase
VTDTPAPVPTATPGVPQMLGTFSVLWKVQSSWGTGYVIAPTVTGYAPTPSWSVTWDDPYATSIANSWGMTCKVVTGTVTCKGSDWTTSLRTGQVVNVGVQVNSTKLPDNPVLR